MKCNAFCLSSQTFLFVVAFLLITDQFKYEKYKNIVLQTASKVSGTDHLSAIHWYSSGS